jgi:ribosomal protein L37AE/L43A
MNRLNNSHACIACARRSDGLAVGRPQKLGWYCVECGPNIAAKALYMKNLDAVEQRACEKVAAEAGQEPITLAPEELPAFIAWAVKSFAETMRKDLDQGGAPF